MIVRLTCGQPFVTLGLLLDIDRVPDMDQEEKERLKAEAKTIVAIYYIHMLRHYGALPIVDKVIAPDDADFPARATLDETVKFILRILQEAIDCPHFPWNISPSDLANWDELLKLGPWD